MADILITGGAGFIGANLTRRLLQEGNAVLVLDNLSSGNLNNLPQYTKKFSFIHHDVREKIDLKNIPVDQIYHLACPASPPFYQKDPLSTLETSILGTRNILQLAKNHGAKMLFSSTSETYGNPLEHPQKETYWGNVNAIGERSCYDEGKRAAETFSYLFNQQGLDLRVVRIFNTYGPFMDANDGRVVSNFINQALENKPITIYGSGNQTRSFCYVDDLVDGLVKFMNLKEPYFGPINLGNPGEFTVKELAEKVKKLIPESTSQIEYHPLPSDDPEKRKPFIERANQVLGWQPKIQLEEGLIKTIKYFEGIQN